MVGDYMFAYVDISKVDWLYDDFWYRKRPYFLYQTEGKFKAVDFESAIRYTSKAEIGRRAVISLSRSLRRFIADHGYIAEFLVKFPDEQQSRCYIGTTNGWAGRGEPAKEPSKGVFFRCYNGDELGTWECVWSKGDKKKTKDTGVKINRKKYKLFKIVKSGDMIWKFDYYIDNVKVAEIIDNIANFGTDLIPWIQVSSRENKAKMLQIDALQLAISRESADPPIISGE